MPRGRRGKWPQVRWARYPLVAGSPHARAWLTIQADFGLAAQHHRGLRARAAGVPRLQRSSARWRPTLADREHIAAYVRDLAARPNPRGAALRVLDAGRGPRQRHPPAAAHRRPAVLRLPDRGGRARRTTPSAGAATRRARASAARATGGSSRATSKLPWIPARRASGGASWRRRAAEPLRNRLMLALAYDAALRREELCALATGDLDPARAAAARPRRDHQGAAGSASCPTPRPTGHALRRLPAPPPRPQPRARAALPLRVAPQPRRSPSRSGPGRRWSRASPPRRRCRGSRTHTLRHLCLTDLARAGWDIHEIATLRRPPQHPDDAALHPPERAGPGGQARARHGARSTPGGCAWRRRCWDERGASRPGAPGDRPSRAARHLAWRSTAPPMTARPTCEPGRGGLADAGGARRRAGRNQRWPAPVPRALARLRAPVEDVARAHGRRRDAGATRRRGVVLATMHRRGSAPSGAGRARSGWPPCARAQSHRHHGLPAAAILVAVAYLLGGFDRPARRSASSTGWPVRAQGLRRGRGRRGGRAGRGGELAAGATARRHGRTSLRVALCEASARPAAARAWKTSRRDPCRRRRRGQPRRHRRGAARVARPRPGRARAPASPAATGRRSARGGGRRSSRAASVPAEWVAWCRRWQATSTSRAKPRQRLLLQAAQGRPLAGARPTRPSPTPAVDAATWRRRTWPRSTG